jgi:hypothetical protein
MGRMQAQKNASGEAAGACGKYSEKLKLELFHRAMARHTAGLGQQQHVQQRHARQHTS